MIEHVDVVPEVAAAAVDHEWLAVEGPPDELGDHQLVAHPRSERDAVPENRERHVVQLGVVVHDHLGRDLRRRVDVSRMRDVERRVLVERSRAVRAGVDPHGRCQDGSAHLIAPGGFPDVGRTGDVDVDGRERSLERVIDVGDARQVKDDVDARKHIGERVGIADVDPLERDVGTMGLSDVENGDVVTRIDEAVDHV